MFRKISWGARKRAFAVGAALLFGAGLVGAANGVDDALAGWLGQEITIKTSSHGDDFPIGGKVSFVFDDKEKLVRVCTRQGSEQDKPWRSDLAEPCGVTLTFTKGTRYCTVDDVKTGDAELLSTCHRMRSKEIALQQSAQGTEVHDLVVFLVRSEPGKPVIAILVDSPSRVTGGTVIVGGPG